MKKALKTAPRGTAFNYAGQRWVVLEHNATGTLCLTEKIVEDRAFDDGNCNDFSKSSSLRYDSTAPIEAKRAVIRSSDLVYSKLGTRYAVEQIVRDYFRTGEVREWYEYGGEPHHFKVLSDNPELVNNNLELFLKLLGVVKRRSSWLDAILICLTGEMFLSSGMAVREHSHEEHVMGCDEIYLYTGAAVHDNNRETVTIGTGELIAE